MPPFPAFGSKDPAPTVIIVRRRVASGGHGHHGGSWKVALADFMTSMMALFLVLWLVQDSPKKAAIAGYFRDPKGTAEATSMNRLNGGLPTAHIPTVRPPSRAPGFDQLKKLQERIQISLSEIPEFHGLIKHLEFEMTEEGLRISMSEDSLGVFFQAGRAIPTPSAARFLAVLGQQLGTVENQLVMEGHTDATPFRSRDAYGNWELSADRANTARRIFDIGGTRPRQVVEVRGMADHRLRYPDQPTSPANRRITVTVLSPEATARRERGAASISDSLTSTVRQ